MSIKDAYKNKIDVKKRRSEIIRKAYQDIKELAEQYMIIVKPNGKNYIGKIWIIKDCGIIYTIGKYEYRVDIYVYKRKRKEKCKICNIYGNNHFDGSIEGIVYIKKLIILLKMQTIVIDDELTVDYMKAIEELDKYLEAI